MIARLIPIAAALLLLAACSHPEASLSDTAGGAGGTAAGANGGIGSTDAAGIGSGSELPGGAAGHAAAGTQADLEVNVGDRVFFGLDSSTLDATGRQTVERQAAWLQQFPAVTVTVEGHTDQRGTTEYNLALGERRGRRGQELLGITGRQSWACADHLLRQGAPGRPGQY